MNQDAFSSDSIPVLIPELGVEDATITFLMWMVPNGAQVIPGERIAELLMQGVVFTLDADAEGTLIERPGLTGETVTVGQSIGEIRPAE